MQAITVSDRDAGVAGLSLADLPYPQAADNDVVVRVHAAGFTPGSLTGRTLGSTARVMTGHRACPATSCRASWLSWATAPPF